MAIPSFDAAGDLVKGLSTAAEIGLRQRTADRQDALALREAQKFSWDVADRERKDRDRELLDQIQAEGAKAITPPEPAKVPEEPPGPGLELISAAPAVSDPSTIASSAPVAGLQKRGEDPDEIRYRAAEAMVRKARELGAPPSVYKDALDSYSTLREKAFHRAMGNAFAAYQADPRDVHGFADAFNQFVPDGRKITGLEALPDPNAPGKLVYQGYMEGPDGRQRLNIPQDQLANYVGWLIKPENRLDAEMQYLDAQQKTNRDRQNKFLDQTTLPAEQVKIEGERAKIKSEEARAGYLNAQTDLTSGAKTNMMEAAAEAKRAPKTDYNKVGEHADAFIKNFDFGRDPYDDLAEKSSDTTMRNWVQSATQQAIDRARRAGLDIDGRTTARDVIDVGRAADAEIRKRAEALAEKLYDGDELTEAGAEALKQLGYGKATSRSEFKRLYRERSFPEMAQEIVRRKLAERAPKSTGESENTGERGAVARLSSQDNSQTAPAAATVKPAAPMTDAISAVPTQPGLQKRNQLPRVSSGAYVDQINQYQVAIEQILNGLPDNASIEQLQKASEQVRALSQQRDKFVAQRGGM